jgi:hypothetical protein
VCLLSFKTGCPWHSVTWQLILSKWSDPPTKSLVSRDRLVVRTLRCGRSNPGSNPGHGIQKQLFCGSTGDYMVQINVFQNILSPKHEFGWLWKTDGLNRDLNPGPLAPKARIIPLDHWAIVDETHQNHAASSKQVQGHRTKIVMAAVGFEPTPPRRLVP